MGVDPLLVGIDIGAVNRTEGFWIPVLEYRHRLPVVAVDAAIAFGAGPELVVEGEEFVVAFHSVQGAFRVQALEQAERAVSGEGPQFKGDAGRTMRETIASTRPVWTSLISRPWRVRCQVAVRRAASNAGSGEPEVEANSRRSIWGSRSVLSRKVDVMTMVRSGLEDLDFGVPVS